MTCYVTTAVAPSRAVECVGLANGSGVAGAGRSTMSWHTASGYRRGPAKRCSEAQHDPPHALLRPELRRGSAPPQPRMRRPPATDAGRRKAAKSPGQNDPRRASQVPERSMIEVGSRWRMMLMEDGLTDTAVTILAVETSHVLVEMDGTRDRWGGPERRWLPASIWTHRWSSLYPLGRAA